jgi:hypothetical protein
MLSPTGWFWACVSLLLAFVGSYFLLRTQIEVEPDAALDPKQPMTTPFRITNNGVLPIYNVRRWCSVNRLQDAGGIEFDGFKFIDSGKPTIPRLDSGESTSVFVPISINFRTPYAFGDIEVVVEYSTAILKTHQERHFRFEMRKDVNNEIRWYHKASSERRLTNR